MGVVTLPGVQNPTKLLETLGQNTLLRSANQREAVKDKLNQEVLTQKVVIQSWAPVSSLLPPAQELWVWTRAEMLSLGEKGLFQEGSSSGASDPSHKGDSFSSFQGLRATYTKCHGLETGTCPASSLQQLQCYKEPLQVLSHSLSFSGNMNALHTCEHSALALGGSLALHLPMCCAGVIFH